MKKQFFFLVVLLFAAGITMHAQQPRKAMIEQFTSSTCYPYCPQMNAWLNPLLAANADKVVVVKYQMNWPGAGDPYYTAEGGTRKAYYNVNGVPMLYANGSNVGSQTTLQNIINNVYGQPADVTITGTFKIVGNTITIAGSVTPLISGSGYKIHVVVNEKLTTGNKGTNGETTFHHVMMKMFPNGSGTDVTLEAGTEIPFSYTYDMSTTHVEEMDDLEVAVFVQNASKAILNADYLEDITFAPQNVTATQVEIDNLDVNVTWGHPEGITTDGYNVYRNDEQLNTSLITGTSYQDVAPEYGKTYTYTVGTVVDGIEKCKKQDIAFINVTMPEPVITTVKQIRGLEMLVEWEAETQYPVQYYVYRGGVLQNSGNPTSETSITSKGVFYEEYCFEIEPIFNEITGAKSSSVCVTLIDVPQPENLKAEQVSSESTEVLLTWDASTSNTAGYNIYRDDVQLNTELITTTTYTDTAPEFDVEYTYKLYGVAETGAESGKCREIKITLSYSITGICDITNDALFSLYPNPVSGTLNINTKETITDCQIFNIQGQLIYSTKSDVKEIATDSWASGVYIIRITTEKGAAEKRFIKN